LRERLTVLVEKEADWAHSDVSHVLEQGVSAFDDEIGRAFLNLFPGNAIYDLGDEEVTAIVNDPANLPVALRCMRGTTALVSLIDPEAMNLWVVSLGDCSASEYYVITYRGDVSTTKIPSLSLVLGVKDANGVWTTQALSFDHNGLNEGEAKRIASEHPGEEGCVTDGRVLGAIAVTRGRPVCEPFRAPWHSSHLVP
jgi:pyruvate dehydrogenase phosphatase